MLNFAVLALAICAITLTATYTVVVWAELQTLRTKRAIGASIAAIIVETITNAQSKNEDTCGPECDFCNETPSLFKDVRP